jgi:hypothetical protein
MEQNKQKTTLTTIGIDRSTNRQIDKLCKRYNLKKGEIVKLAFEYLEKACINPSEPPESVKSELAKINKRQDDLIRFIRHFETEQLNPMIRATNAIVVRFDGIVKTLETLVLSQLEKNQEKHNAVLHRISDKITEHANVINNQGKQIGTLQQIQKKDSAKVLKLISLYVDLASCGVMESKRKESLKTEITNLINE